jgi:hypothetical protein
MPCFECGMRVSRRAGGSMGPELAAQTNDGAVDEAAGVLLHQAAPVRDISSTKAEQRGMDETS